MVIYRIEILVLFCPDRLFVYIYFMRYLLYRWLCKFYFIENNIMVFFQLVVEFPIYLHIYACAGFFYRLIIHLHVLSLEIQFSKGKGWHPINQFNYTPTFHSLSRVVIPATTTTLDRECPTFLCMSQVWTLISNVIMSFC